PESGQSVALPQAPSPRGAALAVRPCLAHAARAYATLAKPAEAEPRSAAIPPAPGSKQPAPRGHSVRTPSASGKDSARSDPRQAQRRDHRKKRVPQPRPAIDPQSPEPPSRPTLLVERRASPPVRRRHQKKSQGKKKRRKRVPHPSAHF